MIYPVIMCGGSGSRLWPASRPERPKPFIALAGEASTFDRTLARVAALQDGAPPIIVAGGRHIELIAEALDRAGMPGTILVEPEARDSAAAMAAAAALVEELDPGGICLFLAADHHIPDVDAFARVVAIAEAAARDGAIVTLGVRPDGPSTAYGYIRPDSADQDQSVRRVAAFVEKPTADRAGELIAAGCLWNSGIFIASARTLLAELATHAPKVGEFAAVAVRDRLVDGRVAVLGDAFCFCPKISIDYAVMEKTDRAVVTAATFQWSDLGAWDAVLTSARRDLRGNNTSGQSYLNGATDCIVHAGTGMTVAVAGARNLAVIADEGGVMVCDLSNPEGLKALVEEIAREKAKAPTPSLEQISSRFSRWLELNAMPLWWAVGADHTRGGFHEALDLEASPVMADRRLRVQARQTHVFARAGLKGWLGPWRQAVEHGLRSLKSCYRRADGLYCTLATADGRAVDRTAKLYDQAFVLLALASAAAVSVRAEECATEAHNLLDRIQATYRHPQGGYREEGKDPYQANAQMHLLEAALAWMEVSSSPVWSDLAAELVQLAMARFMTADPRCLLEFFSSDWTGAPDDASAVVEPGHQFEWAWLLGRWSQIADDAASLTAAVDLFEAGERGVDRRRDVAIDQVSTSLSPRRMSARLWPQTERIKAAALLGKLVPQQSAQYSQVAQSAALSLWRYLETPTPGLYRDSMTLSGAFLDEVAPASSLYHIAGAVEGLGELAAFNRQAPEQQWA